MKNIIKYEIVNQVKKQGNEVDYEYLKELESRLVDREEIMKHFYFQEDYESYLKTKTIKKASKLESIKRELERFYEFVEIEKVGRKNFYKLSGLYPLEYLPLEKEKSNSRSKEELRASLEAILLYALKNNRVSSIDMTTNEWLVELVLITRDVLNDYKLFNNRKHSKNAVNTIFDNVYSNDYIKYEEKYMSGSIVIERKLTYLEKKELLENYFKIIDMLRDTFVNAVKHLNDNKMIIHNADVYYGTELKEVLNDDFKKELVKGDLKRFELEEIAKYIEIEKKIRTKLDLDTDRRFYMNRAFVNMMNNETMKGLKVKLYDDTIKNVKYTNVFKKRSIINKFTDKQLLNYFKKNKDVKVMYDLLNDELLEKYKGSILIKLNEQYIKNTYKKTEYYITVKNKKIEEIKRDKIAGKILGNEKRIILETETSFDNLIRLQNVYLELKSESIKKQEKGKHFNISIDYII